MVIESQAFARAGLLGNPSDGYFGKIIAVSVKNFAARVALEETQDLKIIASTQDKDIFQSISDLVEQTRLFGYYGGARLIKAAIKKFDDHCRHHNIDLKEKNFTVRYETSIPRQLGLGGSSAIITAAVRALMEFYVVDIPREILPSLILDAERKELGINAGYMDRVVQVYEGCMYMDLDAGVIREKGHGIYERLDPELLPDLYLAYKPDLGKVSSLVLNDIQQGYDRGEKFVLEILERLAELARLGRHALERGNLDEFQSLMDENFDLRSKIMRISESNRELILTARSCGASAKFAGSGGSIIGMYRGEDMFDRLKSELSRIQARVIRPKVV
ncbi:MAG: GHMP kinase [Candidatus Aminicenantes bacterium]